MLVIVHLGTSKTYEYWSEQENVNGLLAQEAVGTRQGLQKLAHFWINRQQKVEQPQHRVEQWALTGFSQFTNCLYSVEASIY